MEGLAQAHHRPLNNVVVMPGGSPSFDPQNPPYNNSHNDVQELAMLSAALLQERDDALSQRTSPATKQGEAV